MKTKLSASIIAWILLTVIAPATAADTKATDQQYTRVFTVPPDFLTAGAQGKRNARSVLEDAGISFPIRGWACRGCQFKARCKAAGASR